jgi:hypothetical protein
MKQARKQQFKLYLFVHKSTAAISNFKLPAFLGCTTISLEQRKFSHQKLHKHESQGNENIRRQIQLSGSHK